MGKVLPHPFTLSELVKEVRKELLIIRNDKSLREDPLMLLKKLEMELQVDVAADVNGGFKFAIIDFGSKVSGKNTHTIRLAFEPYEPAAPAGESGGFVSAVGQTQQVSSPTPGSGQITIQTDPGKLPHC